MGSSKTSGQSSRISPDKMKEAHRSVPVGAAAPSPAVPSAVTDATFIPDAPIQFDMISPSDESLRLAGVDGPQRYVSESLRRAACTHTRTHTRACTHTHNSIVNKFCSLFMYCLCASIDCHESLLRSNQSFIRLTFMFFVFFYILTYSFIQFTDCNINCDK